ncbi:LemA family protein [bacterium]|nr:LemA family protein [bacterium]
MKNKSQMSHILKKIYARELDLIEDTPLESLRTAHPFASLKDFLWVRQSTAVRVAYFALVIAILAAAVFYYNFFIQNSYQVKMERAHIEAQLQRRNDLIPNLVTSVNNYASYEKNIFVHAADVRAAVKSIEESVAKPEGMQLQDMSFLSKFQAVAEAYPALKASEAYKNLMKELSDTESMIADMRINYNRSANYHNSRIKMFPGNFFSLIFGFKPVKTFESDKSAKTAPKVQ